MKGLEISKKFYEEFGEKMIHESFPQLESRIAVGLIGSGSECFGFDDEVSMDHDFDPGFLIFVPDDISDKDEFELKRAYAKLPMEYEGYHREVMSPVGGNRRGVKKVSDFLLEKTGTKDGKLTDIDFMRIPEESLAELTNGEIWRDDSKIITSIRVRNYVMPHDVILKKLAGELLTMAQSGQYNYARCVKRNEFGAARLAMNIFVNAALHVVFLLNETYMPYYKWRFRAMRDFLWPKTMKVKSELNMIEGIEDDDYHEIAFEKKLESLLNISDEKMFNGKIESDVDLIARAYIEKLKQDGFIDNIHQGDFYLESYAYEVNNRIKDNDIRNMHILVAV